MRDRHGTCSGLSQLAYFEAVRKARAVVKIPLEFTELDKPITVKPDDVAEAFVKANAGSSRAAFAVTCDSKRLSEVRLLPRLRRSSAPRVQTRRHRDAGGAWRINGA